MTLVLERTRKQETLLLGSQEHSSFKLLFVEDGEGYHQIGNLKIRAVPGDLFIIAPNEIHDQNGLENTATWVVAFGVDALAPGRTDTNVSWMLPNELLLLSFLDSNSTETGRFQIAQAERPRWLTRLQQLKFELSEQPFGFAEAARSLLMLLLFDIARLSEPQLRKYSLQCRPLLISVFHFIKENYHKQIGLCDVAKAVNRSPAYLTDLVRRETGKTVLSWIVEYRMANARRLLLDTEQPVNQIAELVGYFDRRHFSRQFLRIHQATPQVWRNANRS